MAVPITGAEMLERPLDTIERFPMSWEEFVDLPEQRGVEWVDGVVVVTPIPRFDHGAAVMGLGAVLKAHLPRLRVTADVGLRMSRSLRGPDVMVVERRPDEKWVTDPPVLVAEVLSPSTRAEDLLRKSREYAEAGVGQYWTVDPDARVLEVSELVEGEWRLLARLDEVHPSAEVSVGEHGVVRLDLADVLDG